MIAARTLPVLAVAFAIMTAAFAVSIVMLYQLTRPFSPLLDYAVMTVQNEGYLVPAKGELVLISTRCNAGLPGETVAVVGYSLFASRDQTPGKVIQLNAPLPFNRPGGCDTRTFRIALPAEVTPGLWRVEAIDTVVRGHQAQVKPYWSEDFRVVAPRE